MEVCWQGWAHKKAFYNDTMSSIMMHNFCRGFIVLVGNDVKNLIPKRQHWIQYDAKCEHWSPISLAIHALSLAFASSIRTPIISHVHRAAQNNRCMGANWPEISIWKLHCINICTALQWSLDIFNENDVLNKILPPTKLCISLKCP